MSNEAIEEALERLSQATAPSVARFDSSEPLQGSVAVLPSAFNPPTLAHLHLLELARGVPGVEAEAALLTTRNVAKEIEGASLGHRIGMLLAARGARPSLAVLAASQARIVDQAAVLRRTYPAADFDFVVGQDTLVRLFDERYYEGEMDRELKPFFAQHRVIATNRGAVSAEEVAAYVAELRVVYAARIVVRPVDDRHRHVSSSDIRGGGYAGKQGTDLPPEVAAYIRANGLYGVEAGDAP